MKYFLILVTFVVLILPACKKDVLPNNYNANARIVSALNNKPITDSKIKVEVLSYRPGIGGYYSVYLDSFTVTSDNNGNINFNIHYNNEPYITIRFFSLDPSTTSILNTKTEFSLEDFKQLSPLTFMVRKLKDLQITVKSINQYNDNDAIGVDVIADKTNYLIDHVTSIQNFGTKNQSWNSPGLDDNTNPYWLGNNVNSIIYEKLEEGTVYKINWNIRKNGVNTDYYSNAFKTRSDTLNTYTLLY